MTIGGYDWLFAASGMAESGPADTTLVLPEPGPLPRAAVALRYEWLVEPPASAVAEVLSGYTTDGEPSGNQEAAERIQELPPAPSSMAVALSGLLTYGAWRLVRSAKLWHLAELPEWYHSAAPPQIAHKLVYDLNVRLAALPLYWPQWSDNHALTPSRLRQDRWTDIDWYCHSQWRTPARGSRSPPAVA